MAEFLPAVRFVLENEGGYANNPKDPGGATHHGISLRFLKTLGTEYGDIDKDGDIDDYDIRLITADNASKIYKTFWWDKYRYGAVKDQIVATKILDFAVNAGSFRAHKIIQSAVNDVAKSNVLVVDGLLGPHTLKALNSYNAGSILFAFCWRQVEYYRGLCASNPALKVFLKGWELRAWRKP